MVERVLEDVSVAVGALYLALNLLSESACTLRCIYSEY
jgi:hypothetical protein